MRRLILIIVASIAILAIAFFINRNGIPGPSPAQGYVDYWEEQAKLKEQRTYEKLKRDLEQDLEFIEAVKNKVLEETSEDAHAGTEKDSLADEINGQGRE